MTVLKYRPVPHDHGAFLAKALARKGFKPAYRILKLRDRRRSSSGTSVTG
jgi:hypothetical protein